MQRMRRMRDAGDKLSNELDVLRFIDEARIMELLHRVLLKRRQRKAIPYFRRYRISKNPKESRQN